MTPRAPDDLAADATWSLPIGGVGFLLLVLTVLFIAGVSILIQVIAGRPGPPLIFWFAALGWNVYWWLFRVAYRVELVGDTLRWRSLLRGGTMPVSAIERVGSFFGAPYTCVLRGAGHTSVLVFTQFRSFSPMLEALNGINSAVPSPEH